MHKNPFLTVDVVIYDPQKGIVFVERKNEPYGWALPGGFVEYGESVEAAAIREMLEETSLHVTLQGLLGVYSDPSRDARMHTISTVFIGRALNSDEIKGGDDAKTARFFALNDLPATLAFDHSRIVQDFIKTL